MNWTDALAFIGICIITGVALGLIIKQARERPHGRSARPPAPPMPEAFAREAERLRESARRSEPPILSTYDGAARLQRARRAASDFIAEIGATNEILPNDWIGIPQTGPRPLGPIDVEAMTRAIITAWIGEEEEMVRVPVMKLSDIRIEPNKDAIASIAAALDAGLFPNLPELNPNPPSEAVKAERLARLNRARAAKDLPPIATLDWPPVTGRMGDDA